MRDEIHAAQESLAETAQRLSIEAEQLRLALELAEDAAAVYRAADAQTRRGYNQAFFKKLYVTPEWDDEHGETVALITRAELTEPYVLLLEDDLADKVRAEAEAIREGAAHTEDGHTGPPSAGVSYFERMAALMERYWNPDLQSLLNHLGQG